MVKRTLESIPYAEMAYGFVYGDAQITRLASDEKRGWVVIELKTSKECLQLYVTKTGKVRIFDSQVHMEWFPACVQPKKKRKRK